MKVEIVGPERLLDHQEFEIIEIDKVFDLIHAIGRICIAAQHDVWPPRAYCFKNLYIPAGFAFQLDALVPRCKFLFDRGELLLQRWLNTDGNAAWNYFAYSAK